jgi:long-chain acyl-CoA synthetase
LSPSSYYEIALSKLPHLFAYDAEKKAWISGKKFSEDVRQTRAHLGTIQKDLCFLCIENNYDFLVLFYSLLLEEFPVALLGTKSISEIRELADLYEPGYIFSNENGHQDGYSTRLFFGQTSLYSRINKSLVPIDASQTAVLLTTSGSTGCPKFVRLTLSNILNNGLSIIDSLHITSSDRAITVLPTSYSFGLSIINSYILAGGSLVLWKEGLMGAGFWDILKEMSVTSFSGVPYSFNILKRIGFDKFEFPNLRTVTQAGGKLQPNMIREFVEISQNKKFKFYVMYGQTEATARISCFCATDFPSKIGSVGKALKGGSLTISDKGPDQTGEILYSGPNVMLGYSESRRDLLRGDELGGTLKTGDIGYIDEDDFLHITGRIKRIGKIAGIRLSLDEVESLLRNLGQVAVIGTDESIVVFHTCRDAELVQNEVISLSAKIKIHRSFLKFKIIEDLPVNANGKIDYNKLKVSE